MTMCITKSLKAVLDGGIEGRPDNVVLYATSNRRHLMPRDMIENETQAAIHSTEAVEEICPKRETCQPQFDANDVEPKLG